MIIIGVDEAGRGPLVGSVVAAAVAFLLVFKSMVLLIRRNCLKKNVKTYMLKLQKSVTGLQLNQTALR